ncbi:MAG: AAA family ATPase [Parvibaculum sp.]|uniref:AAA family ATPase n=1 Tax=Parvibaculum sp. TaxID=2024848 RepID=UPI003C73AF97
MRIERDNFHIFTGGPGSGKTSVIEALRAHGHVCVAEVGRQIIQEQIAIGGDALHTADAVKFRDLILSRSIYTYNQVQEREAPVFFDRGIPELVGYGDLIGADTPAYIHKAADLFRYNKRVFIMPPWAEIYAQDDERKQDFAEAVATYRFAAEIYPKLGYELVEVPKFSVSGRVDFVLASIGSKPEI